MNDRTWRDCIELGHSARRAGRSNEALELYGSAVEDAPGSAEANNLFGLMLLHLGRADEAEAPLRKAVEIDPSHPAFGMNLAEYFARRGRLDEAMQTAQGVTADAPQFSRAWEMLGDLNVHARRFAAAALGYGRAAAHRSNDPSILFKWARASFDDRRIDDAERILNDAARLAPDHESILGLQAEIFEAKADWAALERLAQSWTNAHPTSPRAWRSLARSQWETGYLRQAMASFRTALGLGARDAESLATFGRLCLSALEYDSAADALAEAEVLDRDCSHMLSAKAVLLMFQGRYDDAQSYCRRSLAANPDDASAYKVLTQLMHGRVRDGDFSALERLSEREDIRPPDRVSAMFALADCQDARGRTDEAFAAYQRANDLASAHAASENLAYDRRQMTRQTDGLISMFASAPPPLPGAMDVRPIFIVGMPRSGTTLIESVLGAHTRVFACGERMAMRWIMQAFRSGAGPATPGRISAGTARDWREWYCRELPDLKGATAVTDKNPWNFDALGLIVQLFPNATIVHVRRNPVETGLSIFRNEFSKFVPFSNSLEDIGHYYAEYARLMAHWEVILGGSFTTVQYEEFVARFDVAGPALLNTCGLEWEEACANPAQSNRVISTMSTMQARQPVRAREGRAARYARHLAPLVRSLEAAGVDLDTGGLSAP